MRGRDRLRARQARRWGRWASWAAALPDRLWYDVVATSRDLRSAALVPRLDAVAADAGRRASPCRALSRAATPRAVLSAGPQRVPAGRLAVPARLPAGMQVDRIHDGAQSRVAVARWALLRAAGPGLPALNTSLGFDRRLWPTTSRSRARTRHARGAGDHRRRRPRRAAAGLDAVEAELATSLPVRDDDEDIHMADRAAADRARRPGRRQAPHRALAQRPGRHRRRDVHARRRRPCDARRRRAARRRSLDAAERHLDWPLPGYTHLQRAQPVYLSHHLLAYVWMLAARPRALRLRRRARRPRCRSARARWPA